MIRKKLSLFLVFIFMLVVFTPATYAGNNKVKPGDVAYNHLSKLAKEIGQRAAGTENEIKARDYIAVELLKLGYSTSYQDFSFTVEDMKYSSTNVIAIKPGKTEKQIIIGAHYDSVSTAKGVDDNASGIGVMLELASYLKDMDIGYSIKFIAFGAEEEDMQGSNHYVSKMSKKEIADTLVMINLDSLAVGDKMYVYGNEGKDGWVRDKTLELAKKLRLKIETNPGLNPEYPYGTTGDWSDHAPFSKVGIRYAYFEATNWEIGELDGYMQTKKDGQIAHTNKDNLDYIEKNYPGRVKAHLGTFVKVIERLLDEI